MDFAAAGLLDGLEGERRAARESLLEALVADGFTLEELTAAAAEDRLALLPVERVLGGRYTAREIAERTGLPAELMLRIRRLLGLPEPAPEERVFGDEDLAAAQSMRLFLEEGFGERAIGEITRVLGEGMARLAATTTAGFVESFLQAGDSEPEVARRFATLAEQLTPALGPVLLTAFRAHLREAVHQGALGRAELESGQLAGEQDLAVCFADLVGFTRLGGELEAVELAGVIGTFATLAADVATSPVRLVKTIGDAAMLVSREPAPLVAAALSLLEAVESADLPSVRAGLAFGRATPRTGDFYGHAVNLASRVTGVARPGSVLCSKEVRDNATDQFEWSFAGRHRLKGIGEALPLYRARRPADPAPAPSGTAATRKQTAGRRRR